MLQPPPSSMHQKSLELIRICILQLLSNIPSTVNNAVYKNRIFYYYIKHKIMIYREKSESLIMLWIFFIVHEPLGHFIQFLNGIHDSTNLFLCSMRNKKIIRYIFINIP